MGWVYTVYDLHVTFLNEEKKECERREERD